MSGGASKSKSSQVFLLWHRFLVLKIINNYYSKIILSACFYKGALAFVCMCVQADFGEEPEGEGSPSLVSYTWMSLGAEVGVVNSFAKLGHGELTPQTAGEKCVLEELNEGLWLE